MKTKIALIVTLLALAGAALYTNSTAFAQATTPPSAGGAKEDEPHQFVRRAINSLTMAKQDLEKANHDFGGHRLTAIKACDQALSECKQAMAYDKK